MASLIFTTLWANSAENKLMIFSYFSLKAGFDNSCKLSAMEKIFHEMSNPVFLENFSMLSAEKFTQSAEANLYLQWFTFKMLNLDISRHFKIFFLFFTISNYLPFYSNCLKEVLIFTTLWANSSDNKLVIFVLFFSRR